MAAQLKTGDTIVVTDEEFSSYRVKGVFLVTRDIDLNDNVNIENEDMRLAELLVFVADGSLKQVNVKELWLGSGYAGFKPTVMKP